MFRNYLAAALRNLARNRLMAALNIAGLAIGFAAALLAFLYVRHELSYDRFIAGHERIRVVVTHVKPAGQGELVVDESALQFRDALRVDVPRADVARLMVSELAVRQGEVEAVERVGWGDPDLFAILRMPVVAGDLATALSRPDGVVITRRLARKYFGMDAPLGRSLELERRHSLRVAAIIEDLPVATHLTPEIYGSSLNGEYGPARKLEKIPQAAFNGEVHTYVALPPGVAEEPLLAEVQGSLDRALGRMNIASDPNVSLRLALIPLDEFHHYPSNFLVMKPHGSREAIYAVAAIGLLILLVAAINFVNLMTARAGRRAVEIGVRKASGAADRHLLIQFLGEALIHAAIGMILAVAVVEVVLPAVDAMLAPGIAGQAKAPLAVVAVLLVWMMGTLGGAYPAFVLAAFRPASVLKGGDLKAVGSGKFRHGLVAVQFGLLIALMLGALVVWRQTDYVLRDGLRVTHDQVLLIYAPCRGPFVEAVRATEGVTGVACSGFNALNMNEGSLPARRLGGTEHSVTFGGVGFGFFELYGIELRAGRLFDRSRPGDSNSADRGAKLTAPVVLNESAVRTLGFSSPAEAIGQRVEISRGEYRDPPLEVIGVVADYAFDLQRRRTAPAIYDISPLDEGLVSVRLTGRSLPETLDRIDALWRTAGEPRPIKRVLLDQHLQALYAETIRQGRLIGGLTAIAIFIAALGLFGLAAFTAERRTKEIGIRKAMGAGVGEILRLLLWQFARPVLWANLIAWPVAFFVMRHWLQGFAYHIDLAPWMFLAAGGAALAIALVTVAGHSLLVARTRPVLALRYE